MSHVSEQVQEFRGHGFLGSVSPELNIIFVGAHGCAPASTVQQSKKGYYRHDFTNLDLIARNESTALSIVQKNIRTAKQGCEIP